ncbi:hypothetical protein CRYUN_Cryun25bG0083600 [Craigia yunnanensis]
MLVGKFKGDLFLVIVRPTIVTSTFKEPFPGWIEGVRTIDNLIVAYGKGKITCFPANLKLTVDLIPADMVINAMVVAMMAHANQYSCKVIYHVGSSLRNPVNSFNLYRLFYNYFAKNPWIDGNGKTIKVHKALLLSTMGKFRMYMKIRYVLPLKGFYLVNKLCFQYFNEVYNNFDRKIKLMMRLAELYRPYAFFKGIFDDMNLEKLRMVTKERVMDLEVFNFDPRCIEWDDYFMNIHIPGLLNMSLKWYVLYNISCKNAKLILMILLYFLP